ncbi:MAG: hypothetical protein BJ554DRAFT_6052 [Olpidium bornovanus]|uniref:Uncharacterized protein n=1 Tax=Olpidium bornovanus TaxID=278681 RepID=A0A8H8DKI1_9FUNG|nr:MAG: hypothetical protein BJ554DRAFT_6052 [Olpidium bornovanus]
MFKGIKKIVQERDLWDPKLRLDCKKEEHEGACCATNILGTQPDFAEQCTAIVTEVEKRGHVFMLYHKHHCESDFIERFWGAAKRQARQQCDY